MDRRTFLDRSSKLSAGVLIAPDLWDLWHEPPKGHDIGIILNTVKDQMASDFEGTLRALRKMGYASLEGSHYGNSLNAYAKLVKSLGFSSIASGSSLGTLLQEYDDYIKVAETLEQGYIVCYYPWMVGNEEIDEKESYKTVKSLNSLGRRVKNSGFKFCWHPHNFEFREVGQGVRPFDIIMENTDPEYVSLQMDIYWVVKGGANPIDCLKKYPGRTKMFHVKDMAEDGSKACVGDGNIDFTEIVAFAQNTGVDHWVVEKEGPNSSLECAQRSFDHLRKLL